MLIGTSRTNIWSRCWHRTLLQLLETERHLPDRWESCRSFRQTLQLPAQADRVSLDFGTDIVAMAVIMKDVAHRYQNLELGKDQYTSSSTFNLLDQQRSVILVETVHSPYVSN